ncbi:hypothetical protein GCM10023235_41150 [Kitasatospora terrestris]|uniref:Uncharacterized protein n=1 Tax=Kitasatospora terrestris TaxID=258051 RepID=A0ABP9DSV9_9ACTN
MDRYLPFVAAIIASLMSPILVERAADRVIASISRSNASLKSPPLISPHYSDDFIRSYLRFAADVAQIIPIMFLAGVGVVLSLPDGWSTSAAAPVLILTSLGIFAEAKTLKKGPMQYGGEASGGYSFVSKFGVCVNLGAMIFVWTVNIFSK